MRQLHILFFLVLCSITASSQVRLTDVQSDRYIINTHHTKIGEDFYTIEIDQNDFVYVYTQSTLDNRRFLHRAHIPHSYNRSYGVRNSETHLFISQGSSFTSYDILRNEIATSQLPAGWAISSLWFEDGARCIVNSTYTTTHETRKLLYTHGKGLCDINNSVNLLVGPNHIITRDYNYEREEYTYGIENLLTGHTDGLVDPSSRFITMIFTEEHLYYADSIGLYKYNLETESSTKLADRVYNYRFIKLTIKGNKLFIINENNFRDALRVEIMDLETETIAHSYEVQPERGYDYYILHDNFLIMQEKTFQEPNLVLTNHWNQSKTRHPTNHYSLGDHLDDNTLIYPVYEYYDNGHHYSRYHKIELGIDQHSEPQPLDGFTFFETDATHKITNLNDGTLIEQKLFYRDDATRLLAVKNNEVKVIQHDRDLTNGFTEFSRLFSFKGKLHLLDDLNFYRIEDDQLILLNEGPLMVLPRSTDRIRLENDAIYWIEGESRTIIAYNGQTKESIVNFDGEEHHRLTSLYDFAAIDDCLYFLGQEGGLYRFDKVTREITELDKFIASSLRNRLFAHDGKCYYFKSTSGTVHLNKIDCAGTKSVVSQDLYRWFHENSILGVGLFQFKNENYLWSGNGLHKISATDPERVIEADNIRPIQHYLINDGDRILYQDDIGTHIYDGTQTTTLLESYYNFLRSNDDGTFFILVADENVQYHFNPNTDQLTQLPNLDSPRSNAFNFQGQLYHQTRNALYVVSPDLTSQDLVKDVLDLFSDSSSSSQYGLTILGNNLVCIDRESNVLELDNIYSTLTTTFFDKDSTTYFLASSPSHGNQLYKMDFSNTTIDHSIPPLITYPNPTTDYISLKENAIGLHYELYDSNGTMVQSGTTASKHIKIGAHSPGLYILKVGEGENIRTTKVIIQNQ